MSILRFSDGMTIKTDGKLRVILKSDGYYVVGQGMSIPVRSRKEGEEAIADILEITSCPEWQAKMK
jgi:hypothetical protein